MGSTMARTLTEENSGKIDWWCESSEYSDNRVAHVSLSTYLYN